MNDAKGCLKCAAIIIALMSLVVFVFALIVDAGEKYKCLADLYPEKAEFIGCPKLGADI